MDNQMEDTGRSPSDAFDFLRRDQWQSIETAPNNKSVILAKEGTPLMVTARRHGPISGWRHCHSSDPVCFEPTHWRHYPPPPVSASETPKGDTQ